MAKNDVKKALIEEINKRVKDRILEQTNADLLIKLIKNAANADEAINIMSLGTTYKKTGLHFSSRLEKQKGETIQYFKKNKKLSFITDESKPVNKLIIGDNYAALQNLLIQYKAKIDVVYIDPPYGKDSMGEFAKTNYDNAITRDNLLSMLYHRLLLAKELLSDDGVIFCSIDDKNQAYVKCLFDDVFGEKSYVATIVRKTKSMTGDDGNGINIQHEYLLIYAKNKDLFEFRGEEKTFAGYSNPDNDPNGDWASGDPSARSGSKATYFPIENPYTKKIDYPPKGRYWAFSEKTKDEYIKEGRIKFKKEYHGNQRGFIFKRYKDKMEKTYDAVDSLFAVDNAYMNQNATVEVMSIFENTVFDYPKPIKFISKLIQYSSKDDSIILDFFAGSGTTGHSVLEVDKDKGRRTFILCQMNENLDKALKNLSGSAAQIVKNQIDLCKKINRPHELSEVTVERLRRIMIGKSLDGSNDFSWIKEHEPYGGNLDVYELADVANFESTKGKTPFDVIDETLYGQKKFSTVKEKVEWVCSNFERTEETLKDKSEE